MADEPFAIPTVVVSEGGDGPILPAPKTEATVAKPPAAPTTRRSIAAPTAIAPPVLSDPPASAPPASKSGRGRAAVSIEPSAWECHVPADATVPRRTVVALTGGDAERVYRETLGVVTFGHPVSAIPADAREKTDAE